MEAKASHRSGGNGEDMRSWEVARMAEADAAKGIHS